MVFPRSDACFDGAVRVLLFRGFLLCFCVFVRWSLVNFWSGVSCVVVLLVCLLYCLVCFLCFVFYLVFWCCSLVFMFVLLFCFLCCLCFLPGVFFSCCVGVFLWFGFCILLLGSMRLMVRWFLSWFRLLEQLFCWGEGVGKNKVVVLHGFYCLDWILADSFPCECYLVEDFVIDVQVMMGDVVPVEERLFLSVVF